MSSFHFGTADERVMREEASVLAFGEVKKNAFWKPLYPAQD
jgi:hypothetical protein